MQMNNKMKEREKEEMRMQSR